MISEKEKHETSAEHFEIFKAAAQEFIDLFGLWDWQVDFHHLEMDNFCRATCRFNCQGKQASISLGKEWSEYDDVCAATVRRSAFHEVCELLVADIYGAATDVDVSGRLREERLERATHGLIRRLENVVLVRL